MTKNYVKKYVLLILSITIMASCGHNSTGGSNTLSILSVQPKDGATNISQKPSIIINFSQAVTNVNTNTIKICKHDQNGPLISTTSPIGINNNKTFTVSPQDQLTANMTYYVIISSLITAINNTSLHINQTTFSFTTGQFASPTVDAVNFEGTNTGFPLDPNFQLLFSVPVTGVTTSSVILTDASGASVELTENSVPTNDYQEYSFIPTQPLNPNTTYTLTIKDTITDLSLNHNHLILTEFTFTTGDYTIPTVQWYLPLHTNNLSLNPSIVLQYSKSVNNAGNIEIQAANCINGNCNIWTGSPLCAAAAGNTFTCAYSINNLSPGTSYELIIPPDMIMDNYGDYITPTTFIFTTGARPTATVSIVPDWADTTQPPFIKLSFSEPVTDVTNVYYSVQLIDNKANNGGGEPVQNIFITGGPQYYTVTTLPMTSTSYSLTLGNAIISYDDASIPISSAVYFPNGFNPEDYESPQVISTQVIGGAEGYTNPPALQIIFNVNVSGVFTGVTVHGNSSTGPLIGASITGSGSTYTVTTSNTSYSTYYLVASPSVTTAVAGVPMTAAGYVFSFNPTGWESATASVASQCQSTWYTYGSNWTWIVTYYFTFSKTVYGLNTNNVQVLLNNSIAGYTVSNSPYPLTITQVKSSTGGTTLCGVWDGSGVDCTLTLNQSQIGSYAPDGAFIPIAPYSTNIGLEQCTFTQITQ